MKFSVLILSLLSSASAFTVVTPPSTVTSSATALSLFGGGDKGGGGGAKAPGMMDQLAMLKKAQEMASKKNKIDQELKEMSFEGSAADGKVTVAMKYVPTSNPMDPNPDYEAASFAFDDAYYEAATPEELSVAVKDAFVNGIEQTNLAVSEKYAVLQADLMEALGNAKPPPS